MEGERDDPGGLGWCPTADVEEAVAGEEALVRLGYRGGMPPSGVAGAGAASRWDAGVEAWTSHPAMLAPPGLPTPGVG